MRANKTDSRLKMETIIVQNLIQSYFEIVKKNILRNREDVAPATRDSNYDDMVKPCYSQYPYNTEVCVRITTPA